MFVIQSIFFTAPVNKMSKKSVWFIFQEASPPNEGAYSRHFFIAKQLIAKGYDVHIFASTFHHFQFSSVNHKDNYTFEVIDGVNVCWLKGFKYTNVHGISRIFSWLIFGWRLLVFPIKKIGIPSAIIVSSPPLIPIINGYIFKKRFKQIKLILEIRDIWPKTFIDVGGYSRWHPLIIALSLVEKIGYRTADHIVSTLPRTDIHIRNRIDSKFKFTCIPQGIDSSFIENLESLDEEFIDKYVPKNKFIVGYAGTLGASNALETLIECARELSETHPDILFILLGEGFFKPRLMEQARGLANVSFLSRINKAKIISFLEKCDVLYDSVKMIPLYQFGLSRNKWIDYMYSGKPIITSYSGYLSMINEAGCGVAVPAEDVTALKHQILKYYQMEENERAEIGLNGKQFILNNRTYDKLSESFIKLLE